MIVKKTPVFQEGKVLSIEMLNTLLYSNLIPRELLFQGYSNGILKGFQIEVADDYLIIHKGIYIFEEELLCFQEKTKIPYKWGTQIQILVIRTGDLERESNFLIRNAELRIISEDEKILTDIEVCRFTLQQGAKLRNNYVGFYDMDTTFDTVCLCYSQWSAYTKESIAYPILEKYADELEKKAKIDAYDDLFLSAIRSSEGKSISKHIISRYLYNKLGKQFLDKTSNELFKGMAEALRKESHNIEQKSSTSRMSGGRIIID